MTKYLLAHRHAAADCGVAFAAWSGYDSPLRGRSTLSDCATGGHRIWWVVEAGDTTEALAQLPPYLAQRADASAVREVPIP